MKIWSKKKRKEGKLDEEINKLENELLVKIATAEKHIKKKHEIFLKGDIKEYEGYLQRTFLAIIIEVLDSQTELREPVVYDNSHYDLTRTADRTLLAEVIYSQASVKQSITREAVNLHRFFTDDVHDSDATFWDFTSEALSLNCHKQAVESRLLRYEARRNANEQKNEWINLLRENLDRFLQLGFICARVAIIFLIIGWATAYVNERFDVSFALFEVVEKENEDE